MDVDLLNAKARARTPTSADFPKTRARTRAPTPRRPSSSREPVAVLQDAAETLQIETVKRVSPEPKKRGRPRKNNNRPHRSSSRPTQKQHRLNKSQ